MAEQNVVLVDTEDGIHRERVELGPESGLELEAPNWRIRSRTLRGGRSEGVEVVEIDNGTLRVDVLPSRGMGLWRATCGGHDVGWRSPVARPIHPAFVNASARGGLGWLEGFGELLCRCGLAWFGPPCDDAGWPLTLHGRVANLPAHRVSVRAADDGPGLLEVRGVVDESELFGPNLRLDSTIRTEVGSKRIAIHDVVTNLSDQPGEMQLLYHVNVGRPFLEAESTFHVAAEEVAPRDARAAEGVAEWTKYRGPEPGFAEQVYFVRPRADEAGRASALLANATERLGFLVELDVETLPCLSLWKNTGGEADGYVTGIEPGTGFPNTRPFEREQGRVVTLQPGESRSFHLSLSVLTDEAEVTRAKESIAVAGGLDGAEIHESPQPAFSAG